MNEDAAAAAGDFIIRVATESDTHFAEAIATLLEEGAKARGIGRGRRPPQYLADKMSQGKAIVATTLSGDLAGFCYIEAWENEAFVSHSALIVKPDFRKMSLGRDIKYKAFELARTRYPKAKIFGITTTAAVMKINNELGYKTVPFAELPQSEAFWSGCQACPYHDILQRTNRRMCLCNGMLYDPATAQIPHPVVSPQPEEIAGQAADAYPPKRAWLSGRRKSLRGFLLARIRTKRSK